MLLCLYGKDTYRSKQKLKEIVGRYLAFHAQALNLREFDCQTADGSLLREEFQARSLFKEKKLVVVRNAFSSPQVGEALLEQKKALLQEGHIIVFWEGGEIKKTDKLFAFLLKEGKCQEFSLLSKPQTLAWIQGMFARFHAKTDAGVVEFLYDACGNDLWRLEQEIKKLAAFSASQNSKVSMESAKTLVSKSEDPDIFSTIDQIGLLNKKQALSNIASHLQKGESPLYLLTMIAFQFRNLLIVKDLAQTKRRATKLHPFVVKKCLAMLQRLPSAMLSDAYQRIVEIDQKVKTGVLQADIAPYLFIAQL